MVSDEHKLLGESERPKARRQRDLRSLVEDADVELPLGEDRPVRVEGSGQ